MKKQHHLAGILRAQGDRCRCRLTLKISTFARRCVGLTLLHPEIITPSNQAPRREESNAGGGLLRGQERSVKAEGLKRKRNSEQSDAGNDCTMRWFPVKRSPEHSKNPKMTAKRSLITTVSFAAIILFQIAARAEEQGIIGKSDKYTAKLGDSDPYSVEIVENASKRLVFTLSGDGLGSPYAAVFSEDSSLIAFSCGTSSLGTKLFVYRLDETKGSERVKLPDAPADAVTGDHIYEKASQIEGGKVFFAISSDGKPKNFVFDVASGILREGKR